MKRLALGLALAALVTSASGVLAQTSHVSGRCLLIVEGKTVLNGPCPIQLQKGGGFTVGSSQRGGYFAIVEPTGSGEADGYWNEDQFANHAHTGLGTLKRNDACWANDRAIVCAWR